MCFGGEKVIDITLEGKDEINMGELINEIALHHIKKKPEFFVGNDKQLYTNKTPSLFLSACLSTFPNYIYS